ncbi:hypothetical protein bsdE14_39590 [Clostridium omnivorum]|uniref:Uncharacterized protein n=1 Tax=Clostridium omnivorum TaxID=1604902 RepID=A0ABQ5NBA1_9CLOT|nr:hypothetical protein bsdE14_39590 [Clostridium sp. E14]
MLAMPIDMVCWFEKTGIPHPVRFKVTREDESEVVIKVDKVIAVDKERLAGNDMLIFRCQSAINNTSKAFELKYELRTCKWILYKM